MQYVFLDTNIILDFFLGRLPFAIDAAKILTLSENKKIHTYVSTLTIATSYYILRKKYTHQQIIIEFKKLSDFVEILPLNKTNVFNSYNSEFDDFEDSLQNEVAIESGVITTFITRNFRDFRYSKLKIQSPEEFLDNFNKS